MKKRYYKRNVIDGQIKMNNFKKQLIRSHKIHIVVFIFCFFLAMAISIGTTVIFAKYTKLSVISIIFVPIISRGTVYGLMYLHEEHRDLKILRLDTNSYSDWMKLQMQKQIAQADKDLASTVFNTFQDSYKEQHEELIVILKEQLKQKKPPNPLTVSVIAGLIFLSGDINDYELLFNARYRHSAAGNIIPDIWIRVLSADNDCNEKSHGECAEEFLDYWKKWCK